MNQSLQSCHLLQPVSAKAKRIPNSMKKALHKQYTNRGGQNHQWVKVRRQELQRRRALRVKEACTEGLFTHTVTLVFCSNRASVHGQAHQPPSSHP
ncbi:hypothetical protein AV530_016825 [Patagioenas fasciata monilis]|uniref:Uncharacterized protein n=1 Tax=Patagioenas fasciata monilis TaxID=372326 RepID=A0A1V4J494_PATFA|nr:hypothetical protein AV530_016825 [Patagioenas fasciata monilis]